MTEEKKKRVHPVMAFLIALAVAMTGGFLIQHYLLGVYSVATGSMEPTFHGCQTNSNGDCTKLVVFKGATTASRYDNIVFSAPSSAWGGHAVLAKRVIGVAGDRVSCSNTGAVKGVLVNGEKIDEPYLDRQWLEMTYRGDISMDDGSVAPCYGDGWDAVVVPENSVFVLGDNRGDSKDSRSFINPDDPDDLSYAVPLSSMIGTVITSWG